VGVRFPLPAPDLSSFGPIGLRRWLALSKGPEHSPRSSISVRKCRGCSAGGRASDFSGEPKAQRTDTERQCGHGEKIHGSDCLTVIAKEYQPPLGWIRILACTLDPTRNRSFRDFETQLEQLTVNARRSPSWVFSDHPKDQLAHFPADRFSSDRLSSLRDPAPGQPKADPVPPNHCLRGDEDQRSLPAGPNFSQKTTQNSLSTELRRGRGRFACRASSCCRKARFSSRSPSRERKTEITQPSR
jgi:hypothetical protein